MVRARFFESVRGGGLISGGSNELKLKLMLSFASKIDNGVPGKRASKLHFGSPKCKE